jgi:hypothetical protein
MSYIDQVKYPIPKRGRRGGLAIRLEPLEVEQSLTIPWSAAVYDRENSPLPPEKQEEVAKVYLAQQVASTIQRAQRVLAGRKFTYRKVDEGIRVWRIK